MGDACALYVTGGYKFGSVCTMGQECRTVTVGRPG